MYGADIVKMFRPKYQVATQPKYKVYDIWKLKFKIPEEPPVHAQGAKFCGVCGISGEGQKYSIEYGKYLSKKGRQPRE